MTEQRLIQCTERIQKYCAVSLVEMRECESWFYEAESYFNRTTILELLELTVFSSLPLSSTQVTDENIWAESEEDVIWASMCGEFEARYHQFWDMLTLATWVQIIICVFGILVNCIFLSVVCKRKLNSSTDVYFLNFALADQLICLSVIVKVLPFFVTNPAVLKVTDSSYWEVAVDCFIQTSLYAAITTSSCFTFERALAVCDPLKSMRLCTRNKSLLICVGSWVGSILYNCFVAALKLLATHHFPDKLAICSDVLFLVDLTLFYFAPLIISSICYCKILRSLRARAEMFSLGAVHGYTGMYNRQHSSNPPTSRAVGSKQNFRSAIQGKAAANPDAAVKGQPGPVKPPRNYQAKNPQNKLKTELTPQHLSANRKVTRLMFMMVLSYIFLLSPHRMWNLMSFFYMTSFMTQHLVTNIVSIIYICNCIVNPIICCFCSELYRQQLMMIYLNRGRNQNPASAANVSRTRKQSSLTPSTVQPKQSEQSTFDPTKVLSAGETADTATSRV